MIKEPNASLVEIAIERDGDIATDRINSFADRYGDLNEEVLNFVAHCAFPLTLTTELTYCLREKFAPYLPWSIAPQLLLSGLCKEVSHDLYGMESAVRGALLTRLIAAINDRQLDELVDFMTNYIAKGIGADRSYRARVFGDPPEIIKHTALALYKKDGSELNAQIERVLAQLLKETDDPSKIFQLALLVENQGDLLESRGLIQFLLPLAQSVADSRSGDEFGRVKKEMVKAGFPPLQSKEIEYARIEFSDTAVDAGDALYEFEFETVEVDSRGKIVSREQRKASAFREPDINLEMVAIPSGKFMMGSPESEHDRWQKESPQHEVTVQPFFIGRYPITQGQWKSISNTPKIDRELKSDPSLFKGDNLPVEKVDWEDAIEFCQRLSRQTGRDYRLSTEAEWEYACRAETTTPFYFGKTITGKLANYDSSETYLQERKVKSKGQTTPVGTFQPNAFELYDMHGNVWEWCQDHWHENYEGAPTDGSAWLDLEDNALHVVRGGSWYNLPRYCRSASRSYRTPVLRYFNVGFRVVCEIPRTL